ncbi:Ankyrin repeats-containing protein [Cardinium endosymbiont cBtQ1 of Bemisia tabaci]|uniref:ankyrin repeat domain-containing protein n=2 Tax=Cardinium endosymbiont of Bemisia tabaci TaxID=672794 RepID=UPI000442D1E9|nr:ankyrin repeat domain-containing protein [Cardinium endosymbiont of Bemisia tabaci]CDG49936.1 Ankyrin repeats-containing protein [Cardinium endosymbiont cBtQ1 of Bemisia tabaci]
MKRINYCICLYIGLLSLNGFSSCVTRKQEMVRDIRERGYTLGNLKRSYNRNPKKFIAGAVVGTTVILGASTMAISNLLDSSSVANTNGLNNSIGMVTALSPLNASNTQFSNAIDYNTKSFIGSTRAYSGYPTSSTPLLRQDLSDAILNSDIELVKYLLKNGANINQRNDYGDTPLYSAGREGNIEMVKVLLKDENIDVNATHGDKYTVLHLGAFKNDSELVKLLLTDKRIKVNEKDVYGYTPLHTAINEKNLLAVDALLKSKDIDIYAITNFNETVLDIATRKKCLECIKAIEKGIQYFASYEATPKSV